VWIVDPIDGTREFVAGIPEWSVSIGLIEDGQPIAGGIHNPATGERIIGSAEAGLRYEGPKPVSGKTSLEGALVGASRSELQRGEWELFADSRFEIVPMGSVAYKLALVAAGRLDATWTLVPKNEWDVAAGAALLAAAGGWGALVDGSAPAWNKKEPRFTGFIATTAALSGEVEALICRRQGLGR
jgi:myo-inositol-1(or 4)-monophosphatase